MITRLSALFCAVVAVANGVHPLLHWLEGGQIDMVLGYLNASAAHVAGTLRSN